MELAALSGPRPRLAYFILAFSAITGASGCGPVPIPPTDAEMQTAQHFVKDPHPVGVHPLVGRGTAQLNLARLEDVSSEEQGYLLARVSSIANERCWPAITETRGDEKDCSREFARTGYFDTTIFDVAVLRGSNPQMLRKEWIAQSVTDVATIVWFAYDHSQVGVYENGQASVRHSVEVSVIDVSRKVILAKKTFVGSEPPQSRRIGRDPFTGSMPSRAAIAEWLAGLPWRR
jgi:hypothetical protein